MYRPNLESVALPVPEMISIEVLGGGCEPRILWKKRPYGVGDGTVRKSVGEFLYVLHSKLFLYLYAFQIILPHFSHPSLPKFPHVPLGVCAWPLGYEERRCWANCPCNLFPRFLTYVITVHQRHRQTDGQMTCSRNTALCTIVHRAVKTNSTGRCRSACQFLIYSTFILVIL